MVTSIDQPGSTRARLALVAAALLAALGAAAAPDALHAATGTQLQPAIPTQDVEYDPFEQLRDPFEELRPLIATISAKSDAKHPPVEHAVQQTAWSQEEPLPAPSVGGQGVNAAPEDADWVPKPLGELTTSVRLPSGLLPRDHSAERPPQPMPFLDQYGATRGWPLTGYHWKASCFCHNPLYFEEINLERYGYGCCECLRPAVSAAHFFATVPALPYKMAADCPGECDYTLGHYRPGSCPPWRYHCCAPASALGAASEAGVLTGLIFLIP